MSRGRTTRGTQPGSGRRTARSRRCRARCRRGALLALVPGFGKHLIRGWQVVDEDVLLRSLPCLGALQFLDILVCEVRQQRQIGRIAPQADLAHLHEQQLLRLGVCRLALAFLELLDQILVPCSQLDDGWTRRAEGLDLLAGEDVVALPVGREGKVGADASILAFSVPVSSSRLSRLSLGDVT